MIRSVYIVARCLCEHEFSVDIRRERDSSGYISAQCPQCSEIGAIDPTPYEDLAVELPPILCSRCGEPMGRSLMYHDYSCAYCKRTIDAS